MFKGVEMSSRKASAPSRWFCSLSFPGTCALCAAASASLVWWIVETASLAAMVGGL